MTARPDRAEFAAVLRRAAHPPIREGRFWVVQVLVVLIAAVHLLVDLHSSVETGAFPALDEQWNEKSRQGVAGSRRRVALRLSAIWQEPGPTRSGVPCGPVGRSGPQDRRQPDVLWPSDKPAGQTSRSG
ncbi:MAG: hypothetical protein ACYDC0_13760 [Acidimicrobiales bacterium]